jgi:hypothetical protein
MRTLTLHFPDDALSTLETFIKQTREARVFRRAQAVREVVKGQRLQTVSDTLSFTYSALRKWVYRFASHGTQGLVDRPRSGRSPKITCALERSLKHLVDAHSALWADLGNVSLSSRTSSLGGRGVSATFDHFPLVINHSILWVPDPPDRHLCSAVRTPEGIASRTLRIPLPVGQTGDDFDGPFDPLLHFGQRRLHDGLDLGKRLGRLHPIRADALEAFGQHVLYHPADKGPMALKLRPDLIESIERPLYFRFYV